VTKGVTDILIKQHGQSETSAYRMATIDVGCHKLQTLPNRNLKSDSQKTKKDIRSPGVPKYDPHCYEGRETHDYPHAHRLPTS
jgi:hypothetical protein